MDLYIRAFLIWILIAFFEVLHGIFRAKIIATKVGDLRSRQIGVFSGSLIFLVVTLFSFDWIGIKSENQALAVGGMWLLLMLLFELLVGRYVFHFTWKWLLNDFNILKGRLLALGMFFLGLTPYLVGKLFTNSF